MRITQLTIANGSSFKRKKNIYKKRTEDEGQTFETIRLYYKKKKIIIIIIWKPTVLVLYSAATGEKVEVVW